MSHVIPFAPGSSPLDNRTAAMRSLLPTRGRLQSPRFFRCFAHARLPILLHDNAEAAAIVPHGPANSALFQGTADVFQPRSTVFRLGSFAVDTEFVTHYRHIPVLRPCRHLI